MNAWWTSQCDSVFGSAWCHSILSAGLQGGPTLSSWGPERSSWFSSHPLDPEDIFLRCFLGDEWLGSVAFSCWTKEFVPVWAYRLKQSCRRGRGCVQGAWEKPALLETCFPLRLIRLLIDSRLKVGFMLPLAQESSSGYQMYRRVQKSETARQEKFFFYSTFERAVWHMTRSALCDPN